VEEKLGQDFDKCNDKTSKDVILLGKSHCVATLTWSSVGVKLNTWKSGDLESSGTPECSELDKKGQNTSHWGVLAVIGHLQPKLWAKEGPGVKLTI
jgi:hypothetical protein